MVNLVKKPAVKAGRPNKESPIDQDQETYQQRIKKLVGQTFMGFYDLYYSWLDTIYLFIMDKKNEERLGQLATFQELRKDLAGKTYPPKKKIIEIFERFYGDSLLVQAFYNSLKAKERGFLDLLAWEGCLPYSQVKDYFGQDVVKISDDCSYRLACKPAYQIFADYCLSMESYSKEHQSLETLIQKRALHFWMPEFIRYALSRVAKNPQNYKLNLIHINPPSVIYAAESAIFVELPNVQLLLKQGKLTFNKNGYLNLPALKNTQLKLNLSTFAGDPGYVKLLLVASHLLENNLKVYEGLDPTKQPANVVELVRYIFREKIPTNAMLDALLFPFDGVRRKPEKYLYPSVIREAFDLIGHLPEGKWLRLENILDYAAYHNIGQQFMDDGLVETTRLFAGVSYYESYFRSNPLIRKKLMQRIFYTVVLLAAASFGLLDLTYEPELTNLYKKKEANMQECSFTACRLIAFGRYVFPENTGSNSEKTSNSKQSYSPPLVASSPTGYLLDPGQLTIQVLGNWDIALELLKPWTSKKGRTSSKTTKPAINNGKVASIMDDSSQGRLFFDQEKMLTQCKDQQALTMSILDFMQVINQPLPDYWKTAFMELIHKSNNIQSINNAMVYRLSPQDGNLQRLFAQDPTLSQISLKAEQYCIIVPEPNQAAFKKRLAELGYIPHQSGQYTIEKIIFTPDLSQTKVKKHPATPTAQFDALMAKSRATTKKAGNPSASN